MIFTYAEIAKVIRRFSVKHRRKKSVVNRDRDLIKLRLGTKDLRSRFLSDRDLKNLGSESGKFSGIVR